jgi:hypothetical protein
MPTSWCPLRKRIVPVRPGSDCPVCSTTTEPLNLVGIRSFSGKYMVSRSTHRISPQAKASLLPRFRARLGQNGQKVKPKTVGTVFVAMAPSPLAMDLGDAIQKKAPIKHGELVTAKGKLATAGKDSVLILQSIRKGAATPSPRKTALPRPRAKTASRRLREGR